ncbi:MAG: PilT/PilU family type 4a pilus ATPase [Acidobacteria bacterium]|nr:PilT/PilU family type 4a pilus ATPase [Acidobacteriota bacterium]
MARAQDQPEPAEGDEAGEGAPRPRLQAAARPEWSLPVLTDEGLERLRTLLQMARQAGATDLLLAAGSPPTVRIHGDLKPLVPAPLEADESARLCSALVPRERRPALAADGSVDVAFTLAGTGRCRGNVHRERGGWAAAVRLLAPITQSIEDLNLPSEMARLAEFRHGLVLATGPAGSGKSTTIAALLAMITARRAAHVITIEDPIEYEHPQGMSIVEQVEVGRDSPSFAAALRAAMRQDPDVLVVGEMRDPETIALALTAAETGHLVFSTLHTGDAAQSVSRILDGHPAGQSTFVRSQVAASLAAVVTQILLPRADARGRVPAVEILVSDDAVKNLIRKGQTEQITQQITLSRERGMRSLDHSLAELVRRQLVDPAEARARARNPKEFHLLLSGS